MGSGKLAPEPRPCKPLLTPGPADPHPQATAALLLGKAGLGSGPHRPRLGLSSLRMWDSKVLAPDEGCGPIQWMYPLVTVHWGGIAWGRLGQRPVRCRGSGRCPPALAQGQRTQWPLVVPFSEHRSGCGGVGCISVGQCSPNIRVCQHLLHYWQVLPSARAIGLYNGV